MLSAVLCPIISPAWVQGVGLSVTSVEGNFRFLRGHDPVFLTFASMAEQVFAADPNTTLIKLRQLG